ncbi:FAD-dependent oxidoreductase [uncultured Microbacterium sp.]|uniref:FAD-dependent oxidoreductase n=1 Tax=uncultured Microbacterium sp. TaxID=191216 RepID=UPI0035CC6ED5
MTQQIIAVIGAGLAGAAAAYRLALRGHAVLVLERDVPASEKGSSHGSARIFRYAYPDPFYTRLAQDAHTGWEQLQDAAGRRLITPTGAVDFGIRRDPARLAAVLADSGIDHELLDAKQALSRWPGIATRGPVLWHKGAGVIDAHESVHAMLDLATAAGAEVHTGVEVIRVERDGSGYIVHALDGERFETDQVVVAAGGWLPELLGALDLPHERIARFPRLQVKKEFALHFPYRDGGAAWPTLIYKGDDIDVYGLPGGRDADFAGQKVAQYNGGPVIDSSRDNDGGIDAASRDRLISWVREHLPGLEPEPYAATTCVFTNTPEEDFVIDRVGGITILSPCSGHGAKFAPLVGELAARLVSNESGVPIRFRPLTLKVAA